MFVRLAPNMTVNHRQAETRDWFACRALWAAFFCLGKRNENVKVSICFAVNYRSAVMSPCRLSPLLRLTVYAPSEILPSCPLSFHSGGTQHEGKQVELQQSEFGLGGKAQTGCCIKISSWHSCLPSVWYGFSRIGKFKLKWVITTCSWLEEHHV